MVIELYLSRELEYPEQEATIGRLLMGNQALYRTCEDLQREVKNPGKTAIPCGRYQIIINMSNRFKKRLPLLLDVPGFEGVRIHSGNTSEDTEGCILIGLTHDHGTIVNSRAAMSDFMPKLEQALLHGEVWITIESII